MQTVFNDSEKIFLALCAGASGYILKNDPPHKFIEAISEVYNGGAPISSAVAKKVLGFFVNHNVILVSPANEDYRLSEREKEILRLMAESYNYKAIAEKHGDFGILQIDAHCDLRKAYEGFTYSHASIMYNALKLPAVGRLVQVGVRDYCDEELNVIKRSMGRVVTYFDQDLKDELYEGTTWGNLCDQIIQDLPQYVYISFDIDGLDPKLCPNTGTPVQGGFETEQVFYLFSKLLQSKKNIIGFDLNEVGVGETDWDANVGARVLFKLCNLLVTSNS